MQFEPVYPFQKNEMIMPTKNHSFELDSHISELESLRRHVNHFGQTVGLSEKCIFEINICLDELFTNIVSYGFEDNLAHRIQFSMKLDKDMLLFELEDEGVPFNPLELKDPETTNDLKHIKIGGRGVYIVRKIMNDVRYERIGGKNKLTLIKFIGADQSSLSI